MLAAVSADQRRAGVLHRRFPLAETRDRAEHAMELLGLPASATGIRGDALAWRPEAARYRAGAGARSQGAAARRADRRHGHRRALADDRQGAAALGAQKITVVFIEHDMDIVFKIAPRRSSCCATAVCSHRHAGCDPARTKRDRSLSRHRTPRRSRDMSAQPVVQVEDLDVYLRHQPDPVRRRPFGVGRARPWRCSAATAPARSTTMKAIIGLAPPRRGTVTLQRPRRVRAEAAPHRPRRPRLRAGGPPDLSRAHGRGQSGHRRQEGARTARTNGRSGASTTSFRCWSRCARGSRGGCRAASSRCWRSRAH